MKKQKAAKAAPVARKRMKPWRGFAMVDKDNDLARDYLNAPLLSDAAEDFTLGAHEKVVPVEVREIAPRGTR